MNKVPKALRPHIIIYGRINVGKSSLINQLTDQDVSIVSSIAGTTTDPVVRNMEIQPIGPVVLVDTAGFDDAGDIGSLRIKRALKELIRTDLAILVIEGEQLHPKELEFINYVQKEKVPFIVVINKIDKNKTSRLVYEFFKNKNIKTVEISCKHKTGFDHLRYAIKEKVPKEKFLNNSIVNDMVSQDQIILLVIPIDKQAPTGRLLLPQVQIIRNILDQNASSIVVKETQVADIIYERKILPDLVITDSSVFHKIKDIVPKEVPLTSFSILFARYKGDLEEFIDGTHKIEDLQDDDYVLIAEACSHHPIEDDIGRVKIPQWLFEMTNRKLKFDFVRGKNFPEKLEKYRLIIHCGACMLTRSEVLNRITHTRRHGVPITNYGLLIAKRMGILNRVIEPFCRDQTFLERTKHEKNFKEVL